MSFFFGGPDAMVPCLLIFLLSAPIVGGPCNKTRDGSTRSHFPGALELTIVPFTELIKCGQQEVSVDRAEGPFRNIEWR